MLRLVKRGEVLFELELFDDWDEELFFLNRDKSGRLYKFPDNFIWFLCRLKSIFKIDYRTLEGISRKLVIFIPKVVCTPDYTTLNLRFAKLSWEPDVYEKQAEQEIAGDSTGLKTTNRGEYRMNKNKGKRKKFVKLDIAVDTETNQVIFWSVTGEEVRDHKEMQRLISGAQRHGKVKTALFDRGYDTEEARQNLKKEGIKPVIKTKKTMGEREWRWEEMESRKKVFCVQEAIL